MPTPIDEVCCARLPTAHLAALAPARCLPKIAVIPDGDFCWLRWDDADDRILRLVLPLPGVELFLRRGNHWTQPGRRLPCPGPPENLPKQRLDRILFPDRVEPAAPATEAIQPGLIELVLDDRPRPTSALRCPLASLARWADEATTAQIESVQAARDGNRVFLIGSRLPMLPGNERFWGRRVFVPLGLRPEPFLPERALVQLLGLGTGEAAIWNPSGIEVLPSDCFGPLTRFGIRRACGEEPA